VEDAKYIDGYLNETQDIARHLDRAKLLAFVETLRRVKREGGRLFILGVGGSAANASHAVNDFRKIAGMETYTPSDNVSELTAWTNDKGFEWVFIEWLKISRLGKKDAILILSVGGGSDTTSKNLVVAMEYAKERQASVLSIVSRDGGAARRLSDTCILIPVISTERITPHCEGWQAVVWHMVVQLLR